MLGREIEEGDCFEYAMASEGVGPAELLEEMEEANPDCQWICRDCKYHPH